MVVFKGADSEFAGPILAIWSMSTIFGGTFYKKGGILFGFLVTPPKQMSSLIISNIFFSKLRAADWLR